jgi:hypothetical protein
VNVVMTWIKSNLYTVIFVAIMIVAPVGLWVVAGRMNAGVRADAQARAGKLSELSRLEKTNVELNVPGPDNPKVSATIPVNRRFLDRYEEVVKEIRTDADAIRAEAVQMNRQGRGVLLPDLFPSPPPELRETLPGQMYRKLVAAYERLLADCEAGAPPSTEDMRADLLSARDRYLSQILKPSVDDLTEDEQSWLTEQLTKTRLSIYAEHARNIKLYATMDELEVPLETQKPERAEGEANTLMFDWQWQYWIKEDILRALYAANKPYSSVADAPVKRLVELTVLDGPTPQSSGASDDSAGRGGSPGGFGPAGGAAGRRGARQSGGGGGAGGGPPDPSREVPLDYSVSFTGRTDNPLYDVRDVRLVIVVETARMPEVFDALARQNFMTIIDEVVVEPVDLYEAIGDGYFYGTEPVSLVTLTVETIWLREWTSEFMPVELKQALGIPVQQNNAG